MKRTRNRTVQTRASGKAAREQLFNESKQGNKNFKNKTLLCLYKNKI